ncbi:CMRF35-like molecule 3 [Thalassophryne amazonica]|uniref:CMRF35-like molecule 3 n=1 Tax=Thalassophryne amazonica TaxID=390379 RepID=UPI0014708C1A|nr:CMRF35-like molecule 3 [Thalassophryne amazonica]
MMKMTPHLTLSRMMTNSVICCLLYASWTVAAKLTVESFEGEDISFQCTHVNAQNNRKYLCKDPCTHPDHIQIIVNPGERETAGKITLVDLWNGAFTVTFSQLHRSDSGRYWCGVERTGFDTFHEVYLVVKETIVEHTTLGAEDSSKWASHTDSTVTQHIPLTESGTTCLEGDGELTISSTYALFFMTGGTVAMITVTVLLAIYFRKWRKNPKPQAISNNIYLVTSAERKQNDGEDEELVDEVQPNIKLSKMTFCTHKPRLDSAMPKSTDARCSLPHNVYENICGHENTPECRHSVAGIKKKCDFDSSIIDLPPTASDITASSALVKHTSSSAPVRNTKRRRAEGCARSVPTAHSKVFSGRTETTPRLLWFGQDFLAVV